MRDEDYTAEWGFSPRLEGLERADFGTIKGDIYLDLDVTDSKVIEYIDSIEDSLRDYGVEVEGSAHAYHSGNSTERRFREVSRDQYRNWMPEKLRSEIEEEYRNMIKASTEARTAIDAFEEGDVDGDIRIHSLEFSSSDELVEELGKTAHILGANVDYGTNIGEVGFSFYSPNMHSRDFGEKRARDRFERLRDSYPLRVEVVGSEELRDAVEDASSDLQGRWDNQLRNQFYDFLS